MAGGSSGASGAAGGCDGAPARFRFALDQAVAARPRGARPVGGRDCAGSFRAHARACGAGRRAGPGRCGSDFPGTAGALQGGGPGVALHVLSSADLPFSAPLQSRFGLFTSLNTVRAAT